MNLKGEPAHVGRHCGSNLYDVTPELVAFYGEALDDHHPLHRETAPPLLFHSECYKFVGDWYLARVYLHCQDRFHLDLWESTVDKKLQELDRIYSLVMADISERRMLVLEVMIVALFVIDLIGIFLFK